MLSARASKLFFAADGQLRQQMGYFRQDKQVQSDKIEGVGSQHHYVSSHHCQLAAEIEISQQYLGVIFLIGTVEITHFFSHCVQGPPSLSL
jgi:hypothetical protein